MPEGGAPVETWFDREPPLRPAAFRALARLVRRGRQSWKTWSWVALAVAGLSTFLVAHGARIYTVTVALRVSEGAVQAAGADLGGGALRSHVEDLAFTAKHLTDLMRKHPEVFGPADRIGSDDLKEMRDNITVAILENDFIAERTADDPPRAARVEVTYKADSPKVAWRVAQELAELVIGTTMGGARAAISRARAAAAAAVSQAEARAEGAMLADEEAPGRPAGARGADPLVTTANERLQAVGGDETEAELSLKALDARQALRIEVVDPGQVPVPVPRVTFPILVVILAVSLFGAWVLVGSLDRRVLDVEDLGALGVAALGTLPALPGGRGKVSAEKSEEATEVPRPRV